MGTFRAGHIFLFQFYSPLTSSKHSTDVSGWIEHIETNKNGSEEEESGWEEEECLKSQLRERKG